ACTPLMLHMATWKMGTRPRAIEQADETERQVQLIDTQMQAALSAATPQATALALLAAEAAQADVLVRTSATQIAVSEVMAQATKDENALGAVDRIYSVMGAYLEEIQATESIAPTTPIAVAEQVVRRAVARSAAARAHTAVAQAEVALAQARVLKIDLEPFEKTVQAVYDRLRTTETAADLVATSNSPNAQAAVAAAQASAAAAVAWAQIAISDIQLAIARATRDDSESLEQLIIAAETQLQDARRWAVDAEATADVAMGIATQAAGSAAASALDPVRAARQAVAQAQAQAQVSVAKAQAAMLDVQLAIARSQNSHQTAAVAEQATALARLAAQEVQLSFTLSSAAPGAVRTASSIVTVAAAVMPTRPRTWYEEVGVFPDVSAAPQNQVTQPLTPGSPAFDDLRPPTASCGVSCSQ
uniref:hypothetical protein n=1 Tax=Candidatus Entotheonella palauensis TaxID=93172 RepID=UPI001C4E2352